MTGVQTGALPISGPLTLRQLVWAAEGRNRSEWSRAAAVLAMIANTARDPKKKPSPWQPGDFNPYTESVVVARGDLSDLQDAFVDRPVNIGNNKRRRKSS